MEAFRWLRLGAGVGIALLVLAIASEAWLDYQSPDAPDASSGKTVEIRQRDGSIYVTQAEFYCNRSAYGAGAALVAGCLLGMWGLTRRK